jgi:hypothetical protein
MTRTESATVEISAITIVRLRDGDLRRHGDVVDVGLAALGPFAER